MRGHPSFQFTLGDQLQPRRVRYLIMVSARRGVHQYEQVRKFFSEKRTGGPNPCGRSDQRLESPKHCGEDCTRYVSARHPASRLAPVLVTCKGLTPLPRPFESDVARAARPLWHGYPARLLCGSGTLPRQRPRRPRYLPHPRLVGALLGRAVAAETPPLQSVSPGRSLRIFACPRVVMKIFAGLMSLWTTPFWCAASSPSTI